jgi:hypothetical protein
MNTLAFSSNLEQSYKKNENIQGKTIIHLNTPSQIHQLKLEFFGVEKVSIGELKESNIFLKHSVDIQQRNVYKRTTVEKFCHFFSLKNNFSSFRTGTFTYAFNVKLPNILPSTFLSQYGSIKYFLVGKVLIQMENGKRYTLQSSFPISIQGQLLEDYYINQRIPSFVTEKKSFLFTPKQFFAQLKLDSKIFKVGNYITGEYSTLNESHKMVTQIQISLRQKFLIFHKKRLISDDEFVVSNYAMDVTKDFDCFSMKIPETLPETINKRFIECGHVGRNLQIKYRVKMKVDFRFALSVRISIPIVIVRVEEDPRSREEIYCIPSAPPAPLYEVYEDDTLVELK